MKVRALKGWHGVETIAKPGDELEVSEKHGKDLIASGLAEAVAEQQSKPADDDHA
jgi:hypothetical protein